MKSIMCHYNGCEGVEELRENDEVAKLLQGMVIERGGEYWRIIQIQMHIAVSEERPLDLIKVYLEGPLRAESDGRGR
jgi:hypothetical protein